MPGSALWLDAESAACPRTLADLDLEPKLDWWLVLVQLNTCVLNVLQTPEIPWIRSDTIPVTGGGAGPTAAGGGGSGRQALPGAGPACRPAPG